MKNRVVVITYTHRPSVKLHNFVSKVLENGKPIKQKNFSIGRDRDLDEAYEAAVKAAQLLSKDFKAELTIPSKNHLIDAAGGDQAVRFKTPKNTSPIHSSPSSVHASQLVERFGHAGKFTAMIKHALKLYGVEKVEEILIAGLQELTSAKEELARENTVRNAANRKIAEAILDAREAGVTMDSPNDEVSEFIEIIKNQRARKLNKAEGRYSGKKYMLNGESWDGNGHVPASFAKWMSEDESRRIETLAVA